MLAFIRGDSAFLSPDQIWMKHLPDGEPVQPTNVRGNKYGPMFSSDGSRIAFTVAWPHPDWETFTVSAAGGHDARSMLPNAAGLPGSTAITSSSRRSKPGCTWGSDEPRESFGPPRGVFPPHERAMAHYSALSPDRRSVLIVEMTDVETGRPCCLVPFDSNAMAQPVGPPGACTAAGWSPDGRWMHSWTRSMDGGTSGGSGLAPRSRNN